MVKHNTRYVPASQGTFHRFHITRRPIPRGIGEEVRVAYDVCTSDGLQVSPVTAQLWEQARQVATWNLAPAEVRALDNLELRKDGSVGPKEGV